MKASLFRKRLLSMALAGVLFAPSHGLAGTLDSFEKKATQSTSNKKKRSKSGHDHGPSCGCDHHDSDDSLAIAFLVWMLASGGAYSAERETAPAQSDAARAPGEALIPRARVDLSAQQLGRDIYAGRLGLELGWGPVAARLDMNRLAEHGHSDPLDLTYALGAYRMSLGNYVEWDWELGAAFMQGKGLHSAFAVGLPIRVHPSPVFGMEFRPVWSGFGGDTVADYEACFLLGSDYLSAKVGYRWLSVADLRLAGPSVGIAARW